MNVRSAIKYVFFVVNQFPSVQNGRHFAEDILKCIFMNEQLRILIQILLKFVRKGLVDTTWALVQVMAWRRTGDKPLPEPMLILFTDVYAALGEDELTR